MMKLHYCGMQNIYDGMVSRLQEIVDHPEKFVGEAVLDARHDLELLSHQSESVAEVLEKVAKDITRKDVSDFSLNDTDSIEGRIYRLCSDIVRSHIPAPADTVADRQIKAAPRCPACDSSLAMEMDGHGVFRNYHYANPGCESEKAYMPISVAGAGAARLLDVNLAPVKNCAHVYNDKGVCGSCGYHPPTMTHEELVDLSRNFHRELYADAPDGKKALPLRDDAPVADAGEVLLCTSQEHGDRGYVCCLEAGHAGYHVATLENGKVVRQWSKEPAKPKPAIEPLELLLLKLRNAIATKESYIAQANQQLQEGGWRCDWTIGMNQIESEINELIAAYNKQESK